MMRRDRAARSFAAHDFLYAAMAEEMLERLGDVTRDFTRALVIGCPDDRIAQALRAKGRGPSPAPIRGGPSRWPAGGDLVREDALPYPPGSFDLILCCGTLESVNDLPGALIGVNRALVPDGLLLVSFIGAGIAAAPARCAAGGPTATGLRNGCTRRWMCARSATCFIVPASPCRSPTMSRSTFAMVHCCRCWRTCAAWARPSVSISAPPPLTRAGLARAMAAFAGMADADGRTTERFVILHGSGWRPDPSQAGPARRGSGKVSLAEALKPKPK